MPMSYGFVRESGEKQAASGLGEEAQRLAVLRYHEDRIAPQGVQWGRFYMDVISASKRLFVQRPQARQLMRVVLPGDHIVVAFSSRAFRNTRDCLNTEAVLSQMGITLHCLDIAWDTSTPTGKAMRQMMAVVDELSSGMTSDRNRAAAAVLKRQGKFRGGGLKGGGRVKPYGWFVDVVPRENGRTDKILRPDWDERRVMEYMVRRHDLDVPRVYKWQAIADELNAKVAAGEIKSCRHWTDGKVHKAIDAFWCLVDEIGLEWIVDHRVREYVARTAPGPRGGYDKTAFRVTWADGETYEGRYDLHHVQCRQENPNGRIDVGDHMRGFLEFYAGLRKPSHMKQEDYEHCIGRHGSEFQAKCREALEKYET